MAEIKSFLGKMGFALRKLLRGENAIADYEDIHTRKEYLKVKKKIEKRER